MTLLNVFLRFNIFFLLALNIFGFANTKNNDFKSQLLEQKIEYFYSNPHQAIAKEIIQEISETDQINNFFYLFVALAQKYPCEIVKWIKRAHIDLKKHPTMINALHFAGLQSEAILLAQKEQWPIDKQLQLRKPCPPTISIPREFPGLTIWMPCQFYITGNIDYIKKIIDVFEIKDQSELKKLIDEAKYILINLMFKHDKIYQLCKKEVKSRAIKSKTILNELLSNLHNTHSNIIPEQQGKLKAMITISDDPDFEKLWSTMPIISSPKCTNISSIPFPSENKTIKIFLLFSGIKLDKDSYANVTYDLKITNPKSIKIAELHDLQAAKRIFLSRFFYQLADVIPSFDFTIERTDQEQEQENVCIPGIYNINIILKDHNANKTLNLNSLIEILPK